MRGERGEGGEEGWGGVGWKGERFERVGAWDIYRIDPTGASQNSTTILRQRDPQRHCFGRKPPLVLPPAKQNNSRSPIKVIIHGPRSGGL